jgi:hypothetical protein
MGGGPRARRDGNWRRRTPSGISEDLFYFDVSEVARGKVERYSQPVGLSQDFSEHGKTETAGGGRDVQIP